MIGFTEAQIMAWVAPVFWPFLRTLALFTSAPVLSARALSARTRVALAFLVSLCALPGLANQPVISLNDPLAVGVAIQQVTVGLAIGLAARVVFSAVELAGEVIGLQMGLNFAGFFDPATSSQSSTVGRFFGNTTMLLFMVLNGHLLLIHTVVASFETFPLGGDVLQPLVNMKLHNLGAVVFSHGLWLAMPLIGILLFVNTVLGFMSRIAPQMNVFAIGFPLTLSAGLLGIVFTLPMLDQPMVNLMKIITGLFVGN